MRRAAVVLFVAPLLVLGVLYLFDALPELAAVVFIIWMLISIPFSILVVLDWFREAPPKGPAQRLWA